MRQSRFAFVIIRNFVAGTFDGAGIEGSDPVVPVGDTDKKDVRDAAAASKIQPCVLLTWKASDFAVSHLANSGVDVKTPDEFPSITFDANPEVNFLYHEGHVGKFDQVGAKVERFFGEAFARKQVGVVRRALERFELAHDSKGNPR